jgi:hypothetical protein
VRSPGAQSEAHQNLQRLRVRHQLRAIAQESALLLASLQTSGISEASRMSALAEDCPLIDTEPLPIVELPPDRFAEGARIPGLDRISPELTQRLAEFFQIEQKLDDMRDEAFRLHALQLDQERAE